MKRILAALLLLPFAAACTDELDGQQRIGRADAWALSAASPSGPPVSCVDQARIRGHAVRDARTVDFTMDDGTLLRNRLPFACPGLLQGARITYRTALPRLCSTALSSRDANGDAGQLRSRQSSRSLPPQRCAALTLVWTLPLLAIAPRLANTTLAQR